MHRYVTAALLAVSITFSPGIGRAVPGPPATPIEAATENYFGTSVTDPYRWMERGAADRRFLPYLRAQNAYTASLLAPLRPQRDALRRRLRSLSTTVARVSNWQLAGTRLFYLHVDPSANVATLRVREPNGRSRTLFDPASYGDAKDRAAIDYYRPSFDGARVAIGISLRGSEDDTIRVIETATGATLADAIPRAQYGSPAWRDDGRSFYYSRLQTLPPNASPNEAYDDQRVYVHVLGTDPGTDVATFGPGVERSLTLPPDGFTAVETVPGTSVVVGFHSAGTTDPTTVYVSATGQGPWTPLISQADHLATSGSSALAIRGTTLYAMLQDMPNGRIVAYDLLHATTPPRTIVAASDRVLEGVYATRNAVYLERRGASSFGLTRLGDAGAPDRDIALPFDGTLYDIDAQPAENGVRLGIDSWTHPPALYAYDEASGRVSDTGVVPRERADVAHLSAREVLAPTTDAASVPISIIARDDIVLDGSHPTLMEGYGAYGVAFDPAFSSSGLEWARRGGVYAIAHVRGGGEYGERWHLAGEKATKQHTVDDMIATARYLIARRYTTPAHLAVRGTSAGGIAVGGAIVQHPELFAAAVDDVGMTNLLRFAQTEDGAASVPEFGDVNAKSDFSFMYPLDAYDRIVAGTAYPAVFGNTGVDDPRVPAWMVAKTIARLQNASSSAKPVVLRTDFGARHAPDSNRTQQIDERADEWTFLLWQLGDPAFQPK